MEARTIRVSLSTNINKAVTQVESWLAAGVDDGGGRVVVEGQGKSISKAITIVEIVRRKQPLIKQDNALCQVDRAVQPDRPRRDASAAASKPSAAPATAATDDSSAREASSAGFPAGQPVRVTSSDQSKTAEQSSVPVPGSQLAAAPATRKVSCLRMTLTAPG